VASETAVRIRKRLLRFGVSASGAQISAVSAYIGHLAKWNNKINLTALDLSNQLDDALDRLVVEPFLAADLIRTGLSTAAPSKLSRRDIRILDLGSGGGSPGIPLAIALETTRLTLVESRARKASFLRDVLRELGWPGSAVLQVRTEELWSKDEFMESADVISVRALAMDEADWRGAAKLLAPGGRIAWFRSAGQAETGLGRFLIEHTKPLQVADSQVSVLRLPEASSDR
jgi:16S rRNA (guanine527-N7)-methyltransferase